MSAAPDLAPAPPDLAVPDPAPAVPEIPWRVLRRWPQVDPATWEWLSPRRLRGRDRDDPWQVWLVVVDEVADRAVGTVVAAGADEQAAYGRLMAGMTWAIGRQIACLDGVPITDPDTPCCLWCGLSAHVHDGPLPAGDDIVDDEGAEFAGWFA